MSNLKEYRYTVHYMEVDSSGLLQEGSEYIKQTTLPVYAASQTLVFENTGMLMYFVRKQ